MRAFLKGFLFIIAVALGSEAFAGWHYSYSQNAAATFYKYGSAEMACDAWASVQSQSNYYKQMGTQGAPNAYGISSQQCTLKRNGTNAYITAANMYNKVRDCPAGEELYTDENGLEQCGVVEPEAPQCGTDTIPGGPVNGGFGGGIYNVNSCAYSCKTDYSKLDGNTSMYDAQSCTGMGQPYTSPEPDQYQDAPQQCDIASGTGSCYDMDKQPGGSCPTGTTYGRVNDKEVCVPSGTTTDPMDQGSQGNPDAGGNMQSQGTPDRAGTGGAPTGTGTSSSTNTSTTTDNGDGTSTTTGESESEMQGPSTFGGHGDPKSWWTSNYPDGAAGIASKFSADMGNGPFMAMLNPLSSLPSQGSEPSWNWDMNMGPLGNYSGTLTLPAGVWLFIRVCILFTAAMTVRKLIFGG